MNTPLIVQIPAAVNGVAGVFRLPFSYKIFTCLTLTDQFTAQSGPNGASFIIKNPGQGFGSEAGATFGQLILTNATGNIVTATVYLGNEALPTQFTNTATSFNLQTLSTQQLTKVVAAHGNPVALDAAKTFQSAVVVAIKANRAANAGNIYIGAAAGAGAQPITLGPGDTISLSAPFGSVRKFSDIYIDSDNDNDGVIVIYS